MAEELTEEQKKKNETAKKLADILFKTENSWSWDKADGDIMTFAQYKPDMVVKVREFDREKKKFKEDTDPNPDYRVTGADFRYALTLTRAFGASNRMSEAERKFVYKEVYGQETKPVKGTKEYRAGYEKLMFNGLIVTGEVVAHGTASPEELDRRKKEEEDKSKLPYKKDAEPKEPGKDSPEAAALKEAQKLFSPGEVPYISPYPKTAPKTEPKKEPGGGRSSALPARGDNFDIDAFMAAIEADDALDTRVSDIPVVPDALRAALQGVELKLDGVSTEGTAGSLPAKLAMRKTTIAA